MSEYIVQDTSLTAVANKIRSKTGDSAPLEFPDEFITAIDSIENTPPTAPDDSVLFYALTPFTLETANNSKNWDGSLSYSIDQTTWIEWNGEQISPGHPALFYKLYLKGANNSHISTIEGHRFVIQGSGVTCKGNMMNLLNLPEPFTISDPFNYLFANNVSIDFDLEFPAEIIDRGGVLFHVFEGCSSMTKAPNLPALTVRQNCYNSLFKDCISLQEPPVISAVTLGEQCFDSMFTGCTSLKRPPKLPATSLSRACYRNMFSGCKSLEFLPELPATVLVNTCYYSMFSYCSKIKVSTTQTGIYQTKFRIPSVGTGTDSTQTMQSMFGNTGGTFTGTPTINTTYYTSNTIVPAT